MPLTRRGFLSGTGAAAAASRWLTSARAQEVAASPEAKRPPNILVLIADDLRFDAMGAMLNRVVRTPNLDALAERGVLFAKHFVTTSICPVSRASIYLGQYARRHKIWNFATPLNPEQVDESYFALLRDTHLIGFVGKWGLSEAPPKTHFDYWAGYTGQGRYFETSEPTGPHLTQRQTEHATTFIEQARAANAPFALTVCYKAPHGQDGETPEFQYDRAFSDWYANVTMPRPATATEHHFERLPQFLRTSESRKRWHARFGAEERFQETVRSYYRLVSGVDASIGTMISRLEKLGQLDNTIIVFTSDNGFMFGEHGLAGKWWMFEESIRVPMLICPPRGSGPRTGRVVNEFTLNIDVTPTLLDAIGRPIPASCQGKSVWGMVEGTTASVRDDFYYEFFFEHPGIGKSEGVRTRDWKYISWPEQEQHREMLFNLVDDPLEETDLARDPGFSERKVGLRNRMLALRGELDS